MQEILVLFKNTDHNIIQVFTFNPTQITNQYRFQSLSFMSREWYALIITLLFCDGRPFCITTKNLLQKNVMIFGQIICTGIAILVISISLQCKEKDESHGKCQNPLKIY